MTIHWDDVNENYSEATAGDLLLAVQQVGGLGEGGPVRWRAEVETRAHVARNLQVSEHGFATREAAKAAALVLHQLALTALAEGEAV